LRLIVRLLKSGVMEDGLTRASDEGVPQGGNLSPLLSNVYLHYTLDLWFERRFKHTCRGAAYYFRYADDCAPRALRTIPKGPAVRNCLTDEGRPLGPACRSRFQTTSGGCGQKPWSCAQEEKAWREPGQVTGKKRTAREPLMTCRKRRDDVETAGESLLRDELWRCLFPDQSGIRH
jgi:hypothetical protein